MERMTMERLLSTLEKQGVIQITGDVATAVETMRMWVAAETLSVTLAMDEGCATVPAVSVAPTTTIEFREVAAHPDEARAVLAMVDDHSIGRIGYVGSAQSPGYWRSYDGPGRTRVTGSTRREVADKLRALEIARAGA